jgi:probable rRNA maturation factor
MTVFVSIAESYLDQLSASQLETCAFASLNYMEISSESDLSILVEDDLYIQQLNNEFIGDDAPTDVLSFPAGHLDPDTGHVYLGDVIISFPTANKQAIQAGHSLETEISLLVVHGVLHLLGYDHDKPEGKTKMWSAQSQILDIVGVKLNSPEITS